MIPMDGIEIFNAALQITENIAYYVPRNVNTDQGPSSHVTSAKKFKFNGTVHPRNPICKFNLP